MRNDEDGIAWLLFDKKGASANTLSEDVLTELDAVLEKLERDPPRGLVIRSAKPGGFIAGADIAQFRGVTDTAQIEALLTRGHAVLDRLDRLPLPTVAVIHGYCLGGGLEVALACDYRIAIEDASFGFPEVLLGLHPGLGGTVRLPRLINPLQAMTMMLTGRTERARRARALGLVDAVTQERHVRAAVKSAVTGEMIRAKQGVLGCAPQQRPGAPPAAHAHARARPPSGRRRAHYPAPYALIDLWVAHGGNAEAMQKAEIASFAKLLVSDTAQNLVRVFFLRENLKNLADGKWNGQPRARHRRRHHGRRHRRLVRVAWLCRHARRHQARARIGGAIKRAAELYGKIGRDNRRRVRDFARPPDSRSQGRRGRRRRPDHRGGAGKSRPQAQDLCRHRAEDEARRDPRHQHVEHPARAIARGICRGRSGWSASISSIRYRACSSSRWSATTRSPPRCSPTRAPSSAASTGCRRRSRARRAFWSIAR